MLIDLTSIPEGDSVQREFIFQCNKGHTLKEISVVGIDGVEIIDIQEGEDSLLRKNYSVLMLIKKADRHEKISRGTLFAEYQSGDELPNRPKFEIICIDRSVILTGD